MAALGFVGTILTVIFALIALLAPVWLYFINVYTGSSRDELRKVNKNLETLIELMTKQPVKIADQPAITKTPTAGRVKCEACDEPIPYPAKFAGQIKPCPKCGNPLTLE